jgi:hypothetical protein
LNGIDRTSKKVSLLLSVLQIALVSLELDFSKSLDFSAWKLWLGGKKAKKTKETLRPLVFRFLAGRSRDQPNISRIGS